MRKVTLLISLIFLVNTSACLAAEEVKEVEVTDVWVVFKTHLDIGYTGLIENVMKNYRGRMMVGALKTIEASRNLPPEERFSWTLAGWPLKEILGPKQDPERKKRIVEAIKEGGIAVHALPFSLHTESLDYEELVRGLEYSVKIANDHGLPVPISGKMTDVPEHSWVLPTLLSHAGIKFLQIGCNAACQYPRFPKLFWWEGPDGSRVLTSYTTVYGSGPSPPADWPSRHYLAMIMTGDNHGPPSPSKVEEIRIQVKEAVPGARIHFGTMDDFAHAVLKEDPELKVVRGDTPDTWIHGLMSMPIASKLARNARPLGPVLDALNTQLRVWGLETESLAGPLTEAYEGSLMYGEHTWGINGKKAGRSMGSIEEWKEKLPKSQRELYYKSFEDHRDHIRRADRIYNKELPPRMQLLAGSVRNDSKRILVYNGLAWSRSGLVSIEEDVFCLEDLSNGRIVDVVDGFFLASDVPANGYKMYQFYQAEKDILSQPVSSNPTTLDTPFYKVVFDLKRGGISSLIDKKTKRELVDKQSPYALGQFLHERFSVNEVNRFFTSYSRMKGGWAYPDLAKPGMPGLDRNVYAQITPSDWKISVSRSLVFDVITMTAGDTKGLATAYKLTFTFPRHESGVEVEWMVDAKIPNKIPEGGWLCFPFAVKDPKFTVGRSGGPVDPEQDIVTGSGRHLSAVMSGVSITGQTNEGMGLCPLDSPLVSLGVPGLWQFSMTYVPKTPSIFVNLYNNQWNTNFPLWIKGSWSERVRFWPVRDENVTENLAVKSWEARLPLLAVVADGKGGALDVEGEGLKLSRKGILVTAFGSDPYGQNGTLLRLWEQAGRNGKCRVTLPKGMDVKSVQPVNLRGIPEGKPIKVRLSSFVINLPAYAPASFVLQ